MNYRIFSIAILFIFFLYTSSCGENNEPKNKPKNWSDSTSVGFNKDRLREEELQINLFLSHHTEMKMISSGTGLRYQIVKKTNGLGVEAGDSVDVSMKITLLNNQLCYQTDSTDLDQFLVDRSHVESGVHEGVKYMKEGEKAIFILPSNLAHGLLGDFEKIPPMSPIVVYLELENVIKNK